MTIKTSIRRIGNSKGVILPATILQEIGATENLSLTVQDGRIVLEPVRELRKGWFDNAAGASATQEELEWEVAPLADDSEWQWD